MAEIVSRIAAWTSAQRQHLFSTDQRAWLRDPDHEASLLLRDGRYYLRRLKKYVYPYEARVLQPGQPTMKSWAFDNGEKRQAPVVVIHASGEEGHVDNPTIGIDNVFHVEAPVSLEAGQTLMVGQDKTAGLYDRKGRFIRRIELSSGLPQLEVGPHNLSFDGRTDVNSSVNLKIEIKLSGNEELLHQ